MALPGDVDRDGVTDALKTVGRKAHDVDSGGIQPVVRADEWYFWPGVTHCDCGTEVGALTLERNETGKSQDQRRDERATKLRRKGWSEAKIARALKDAAKEKTQSDDGDLSGWVDLIDELLNGLGIEYVGLMVRFYDGALYDPFTSRRELVRPEDLSEFLPLMEDGVLYQIARP